MPACSIPLGSVDRLARLYSYPNLPTGAESLPTTILHWFNQTLKRDGLHGAKAHVRVTGDNFFLDLDGPADAQKAFPIYADRLPKLLDNGWQALTTIIPDLVAKGLWD